MSLIQEALRRREEDEGRGPLSDGPVPGLPPREPIAPKKESRSWLALFALMFVILVMLGSNLSLCAGVGLE